MSAGGTQRTLSAVTVAGAQVTLVLGAALAEGAAVTVTYAAPAADGLRDPAGNAVAGFTAAVENRADFTAPALERATVDGATLTLVFDEPLDGDSVPLSYEETELGGFWVRLHNSIRLYSYMSDVSIEGATVTLTLRTPVATGRDVDVEYDPRQAVHTLRDLAGNEAAAFTTAHATNVALPVVASAEVHAAALTVVFDAALDAAAQPAPAAFTVALRSGDDAARTQAPTAVAVDARTVTLTLATAAAHGQTVRLDYAKPAEDALRGAHGPAVASFTGLAVINATLHPDTPAVSAVAFSSDAGADGTYLLGETIRVRLTFDKAVQVTGTPRLALRLADGERRWAAYESGSGTAALVFAYEVAAGDRSAAGVAVLADTLEPNGGAIRSVAGNVDGVLAHEGLGHDANHRVDAGLTRVPAPTGAAVDGVTLAIVFSAWLDTASVPGASAFTVTVAGSAASPSSVAVDRRTVTLTLATAVTHGQAVTVSYAEPADGHRLRALDGGRETAEFSGLSVANETPHPDAPRLGQVTVRGTSLRLHYDKVLDLELPSPEAFTLTVDGTLVEIPSGNVTDLLRITVERYSLLVRLQSAVAPGQRVTVSYDKSKASGIRHGISKPIRSRAGYEASSFTDRVVFIVPAPTDVTVNGSLLTIAFDGDLDTGSVPQGNHFTMTPSPDESTQRLFSVVGVVIAGNEVRLTLDSAAPPDYRLGKVRYSPLSPPFLRSAAGHLIGTLYQDDVPGFPGLPVTNVTDTTPPAVAGASVDGAALAIVFDETLDGASAPAPEAFAVSVDGGTAQAPGAVAVDGRTVRLTLAAAVTHGQAVAVRYAKPAAGALRDPSGEEAASFTEVVEQRHRAGGHGGCHGGGRALGGAHLRGGARRRLGAGTGGVHGDGEGGRGGRCADPGRGGRGRRHGDAGAGRGGGRGGVGEGGVRRARAPARCRTRRGARWRASRAGRCRTWST